MHTSAFIAVYSGEQVWSMGLLFLKTSPVKQYSYEDDFAPYLMLCIKVFLSMSVTIHEYLQ